MRVRSAALFIFVSALAWSALPLVVNASIVWSSATTHPDEVRVYTPDLANIWYGGTSTSTSIQIGTWDQPDFTTTASTSARIWARWNGSYLSVLDITLRTSLGGDPFIGSGTTTAQIIGQPPNFYDFRADATSTLQEYTLPVNQSATIRRGDELWVWSYPSWASYGANHWLGSNGTVPYLEICEESCDASASPPSITLLGDATTTAEFGSAYTDLGATAHDTTDGDLTSAIIVTGSVDTGVIGTTTLMYAVTNSGGLSATTTREVVVACTHDCVSNVLFLPGIKGSHLYRPKDGCDASLPSCKDRLWEPGLDEGLFASLLRSAGNDDVRDLFLDANGASARSDIYVKEKDILDSVGGKDFYASFVSDMDALKTGGTLADWEPVAYDWRLSLADIVEKGKKTGERISYLEATSTPYIEQELRRLASTSKTGKVTIVAHSNGGLVAKALLNKLGSETAKSLVDNLIFVGVPQSGAPRAVGSLLYGTGEGLPLESFDFLLSKATAREFSENSPMAYHLLPSEKYFTDVNDSSHAVGEFTGTSGFVEERSAHGSILNTVSELYDFLLALDGGREKPSASETLDANVLNETLIDYARDAHSIYDAWTPPSEITLYQVAGWGVDTVAGLRFTELPPNLAGPFPATHRDMFSPTFVEDGDGVVPVPSALMTSTSSPNVKRYWVNLGEFRDQEAIFRKHGDILEIPQLRQFITNILSNISTLPKYISSLQPQANNENKKLVFILHSPLTLQLTDSSGNTTGLSGDDAVTENISGATYGEFGDVQYIIAAEGNYTLSMNGQTDGTFTLEMQEMTGNELTSSATIANVPTTANTLVSLTVAGGLNTASVLTVDEDGDGATDITITPQLGETVNYEPPAPAPAPEPQTTVSSSGGGGGGGYSTSVIVPVVIITATSTLATTTPTPVVHTVATSTPEFATSTPIVQSKKKQIIAINNAQKIETPKKVENIPQTASVYDAVSQQSVLKKLGIMVYNGLHGLWLAIMRFF